MPDLVEQFWEPDDTPSSRALKIGSVFQAPIQYVDEEFQSLNITSVDPMHKSPPKFQLGSPNETTFNHPPIKDFLNLEYNEALVVHKAKIRPSIVFSLPSRFKSAGSGQTVDGSLLCLPIFGVDQFQPEFVLSVKAFKYVNRLYVPADAHLRFAEGMVQFDRAQMVHVAQLNRRKPHMKLTADALYILQEWFRYYATGVCEEFLLEHQTIELEKLNSLINNRT